MEVIYTTVLILGAIGIVAAILLYIVAKKAYVYENPKITEVEQLLPGANCGGCGLTGCHAFAKACAEANSLEGFNCTGAGPDIMEKISKIVGLAPDKSVRKIAVLKCNGSCENRPRVNIFDGIRSCAIENYAYQGETDCIYGCLGCGDCVNSCIFDALKMDETTGLPVVDYDKCVGCAKCVKACPRNIIELRPRYDDKALVFVTCVNRDKGPLAMKECKVSCIGCGKCFRACQYGAVKITNFLAQIDPYKCVGCGACIEQCPRSCIAHLGDINKELALQPPVINKVDNKE